MRNVKYYYINLGQNVGSAIKSICSFAEGLVCGSQLSVSPVPEDLPSLDLSGHQTHMKCTHIWSSKALINMK